MKQTFSIAPATIFLFCFFLLFASRGRPQDLESWAAIKSQAVAGTIDPRQYRVGPGDEFTLGLWGEKKFVYQVPVSVEGEILIPEVGTIAVNGLTLAQLREIVQRRVRQVFTNVDITFTLKRVRIFRVTVAGEVAQPGVYLASAMDRVSELVQQAGGLTDQASRRRIRLIRGLDTLSVDLASFLVLGKATSNPFLREGDVVVVPVLKEVVSYLGAVEKNGDYELIPGETLGDLLPFTGGFTADAVLDSIELARFDPGGELIHKSILNWFKGGATYLLQNDDRVMIRRRSKWHRKRGVNVRGEVKYPGYYAINRGETTLSRVIQMAGGFTEEASLVEARVIRGQDSARLDPEFERLKKMNPADMSEMEYSYFKHKSQEVAGAMAVDFDRLFRKHDFSQDIVLQDGDQVIVPRVRNFVRVSGEVLFSGNIPYQPGLTVDDYIRLAGGFSWNAHKSKLRVIKARTGEWLKRSAVHHLEPGDTIWVPEKPDHDWWLLFRQVIAAAAQAATVYLVVKTAIQ